MRRLLVTVLLIVFASWNATDGVCCPDGCTDEQQSPSQQHSPDSTDGICVLCMGGVESAVSQKLSPSDVATNRVALPPVLHRLDAPTNPPEHPPRS